MTPPPDATSRLFRMEDARRQTQHQLDLIDRQIVRRMTAMIPRLQSKRPTYRRGKAPVASTFLERYRGNLAALTAERQPEIDALSRKLVREDRTIAALRERHGMPPP